MHFVVCVFVCVRWCFRRPRTHQLYSMRPMQITLHYDQIIQIFIYFVHVVCAKMDNSLSYRIELYDTVYSMANIRTQIKSHQMKFKKINGINCNCHTMFSICFFFFKFHFARSFRYIWLALIILKQFIKIYIAKMGFMSMGAIAYVSSLFFLLRSFTRLMNWMAKHFVEHVCGVYCVYE